MPPLLCRRSQVQGSPFRVTFLSLTLRVRSRANCHACLCVARRQASISSNRSPDAFSIQNSRINGSDFR